MATINNLIDAEDKLTLAQYSIASMALIVERLADDDFGGSSPTISPLLALADIMRLNEERIGEALSLVHDERCARTSR